MDSRGPVFFRQERIGRGFQPFRIYKFRTMRPNGNDDDQGHHEKRLAAMTDHDDERITRVGRTLRNLRLDELPQILNVLRGEMSLIGPRPEQPQVVAELELAPELDGALIDPAEVGLVRAVR